MNTIEECYVANYSDGEGRPAGGVVDGMGLSIRWQNGLLGRGPERKAPNGAFVETVIAVAAKRLEFYQEGPFACEENEIALRKLEEALDWLHTRTEDRERRGVEGTHQP
jgi:hypothetical protein